MSRLLERTLWLERLRALLAEAPAVVLVGPRQCGKTTLARSLPHEAYFDLEQPEDRLRLELTWDEVVSAEGLVVLDEAQAWPELFPRLRGAIDQRRRRMGRFLLLGSVSPALARQVSESLAGRLALLELTPFLLLELPGSGCGGGEAGGEGGRGTTRGRHWLCGGYPEGGVLQPGRFPRWQLDYLTLLAQRDLPNWGLPARPLLTERLLRMVAALHGQSWNASRVGQGLGLSYHTVNHYLEYLVGAFLVRLLPPLHANVRKRLVKRPRIYWRDSGLLHALLGVVDERSLLAQPWVGASWEGYVIEQALGVLRACGVPHQAFFFRTSDGHEIDLVLEFGAQRWAMEAKLTATPQPEDVRRLQRTADWIGASRRFLVSRTRRAVEGGGLLSCDLRTLLRVLASEAPGAPRHR